MARCITHCGKRFIQPPQRKHRDGTSTAGTNSVLNLSLTSCSSPYPYTMIAHPFGHRFGPSFLKIKTSVIKMVITKVMSVNGYATTRFLIF